MAISRANINVQITRAPSKKKKRRKYASNKKRNKV